MMVPGAAETIGNRRLLSGNVDVEYGEVAHR